MSKDTGRLEYKCRRCGAVARDTGVPNVGIAVSSVVVNGRTPWPGMSASITDCHSCPDGGVGISDLIGGIADGARARDPVLSLPLPPDLAAKVTRAAEVAGQSVEDFVRDAVVAKVIAVADGGGR